MANIKWSYMDHWSMPSPRGNVNPYTSREYADSFLKQIGALGFKGCDTFARNLNARATMFGGLKNYLQFMQDRGVEKIVGVFHEYSYVSPTRAPHVRETHDAIFKDCEDIMRMQDQGWGIENLVIMPASTYWQVEPVTDEKMHAMADIWNRVGKMTLSHGVRTVSHHEFWCACKTMDELDKFYRWTDPDYVGYFCDTAQTALAGNDPVALYVKYHDRCRGFHFKDTHVVENKGEFRLPPDPETQAPSYPRWFWEMGAPGGGLVDFPLLMRALKEYNYKGWITVEHDETTDYAESTCTAKWYIDNVLTKIYS